MTKNKNNLRWLGIAVLLCMAGGCSDRSSQEDDFQQQIIWRFAIEEAEGGVQHAYAVEFKDRIEAASDGRIQVIVYPYGSLGTSTQLTEQLNLGALEFAMASPGSIGKFIPEIQVFLLHFVLTDDDSINRQILASPQIIRTFDELYAEKGLKLLSIFPEGEMVWTTQNEIRSPEDMKGVKIRVMTTPLLIDTYHAYGASPTPLPYSEVYSALQLGMVDAQENPVFAIERQKFYEVTDWLIFPGFAHFVTTAAANRSFYESLSTTDRAMVDDTILALNEFIFQRQMEFQTTRLKAILRNKKNRRSKINISGDLTDFSKRLSASERTELIDDNPFLNVTPALTPEERQLFQQANAATKESFLRIGGPRAESVLDLIQQVTRQVVEESTADNGSTP